MNCSGVSVLTVTPCSSLYRPEKFTMYSPSVHPLSNQLPSRRTRTNSEGSEAAILPPSAKIYMPVHVDIFLVLKFII